MARIWRLIETQNIEGTEISVYVTKKGNRYCAICTKPGNPPKTLESNDSVELYYLIQAFIKTL